MMTSRQRTGLVLLLAMLWVAYCYGPVQFVLGLIGLVMLFDPNQVVKDLNDWQDVFVGDVKAWWYMRKWKEKL